MRRREPRAGQRCRHLARWVARPRLRDPSPGAGRCAVPHFSFRNRTAERQAAAEGCGTALVRHAGPLESLELVSGRTATLPAKPVVDALLVFSNFRPRMQRIPRFTDAHLAGLSMPVQVVVGGDDALLNSQETRERVERHVRNASVTCIENAGHLLPPQTAAVAEFLKGIRRIQEWMRRCREVSRARHQFRSEDFVTMARIAVGGQVFGIGGALVP